MNKIKKYKIIISVAFLFLSIICFTFPAHSAEKFVRKYRTAIDLTNGPATAKVGRYTIKADMSRPALPFREIVFRFFISRNGKPVEIKNGYAKFNMIMDMGLYKTSLQKAATGYTAKIILPKCIFGGHRWFVKLSFEEGDFSAEKVFLFDMDDKK